MLKKIQILLFSAIHAFPATVFHSVLLWLSWWREPPQWTPEPLLKSRADRRQGDVQRAAVEQTPWLWVPIVQRAVHLPKPQHHSSGDIPSENKETNPAIPAHLWAALYLWPQGCGSDPGNSTWMLTPQSTNPTALWQSKLLFSTSPGNYNNTSSSAKAQHKEFYVKTLLSTKRK